MIKKLILKTITIYKKLISPLLGYNCRFYPSCSEYFSQAIEKYGVITGGWKGFKRILRCNPLNKGGIDHP